jgi:hypothetical protein
MKTRLYVYTGTGNSLWIARRLLLELKEATLEFMPHLSKGFDTEAGLVGIIFPVHIWGLPTHVIQFVNRLQAKPDTYFFALAVNAGLGLFHRHAFQLHPLGRPRTHRHTAAAVQ